MLFVGAVCHVVFVMICAEKTADSTLVGAQPRIMCWTCAHGPWPPDVILDVPQWWQPCVNFGLQHIGALVVVASVCAHSSIERRQPAASDCWQALHHWNEVEHLETGELIPRGTAEEPHALEIEAEGARDGAAGTRLQQRRRRGHQR